MESQKTGVWSIWVKDQGGDLHVVGLVCEEKVVMDYMEFLECAPECDRVYWSADVEQVENSVQGEREELRLYVVTKFTGPIYMN
ncbi:MAG: hypothetical protein AAF564_00835 [Bacteroidota bacterium]